MQRQILNNKVRIITVVFTRRSSVLKPLAHELRHAVLAGLASVPGPKNSTKQKPGRELLGFCNGRRDDVLRFTTDTAIWPTNNISERGVRPLKPSRRSPAAWPATTSPRPG
jgi:hypothetical protein